MKINIIFLLIIILLKINKAKISKQNKLILNFEKNKIKIYEETNINNSINENQTQHPLHPPPPPPPPHDLDDENKGTPIFIIIKYFLIGIVVIIFIILFVFFFIQNFNKYNKEQEKIFYNKIHLLMKLKEKNNETKEKNIDIDNNYNKSQNNLNINLNAPSVIKNNSIEEKIYTNKKDEIFLNKEDITVNDNGVINPSEDDLKLYKPYEI